MTVPDVQHVARLLEDAARTRTPLSPRAELPDLDLTEAYAVQRVLVGNRESLGDPRVGVKLGFTSTAKMRQMGVDDVIVGVLTARMRVREGGRIDRSRLIHPRVEPEIAFRLSRDLDPADPRADLVSALDAVAPAVELIDSRFSGFAFDLPRVVADNTSAAAFAVGHWVPLDARLWAHLANAAVTLSIAGRPVAFGSTAAILGDPRRIGAALLGIAAEQSIPLRAGDVVLAGAATEAFPVGTGHVEARVAGLGRVALTITGTRDDGERT
ncbi:2-keto-4-pentenoate hydratase [Pseudonocardia sp. CA-142604]|uniref:2-keto-4-pentenoate hydratase n=1 Tax=Pseudonocardia sp. CA-142604 TaxID=3240024 RepID=UPI003D8F2975